MYIMPNKRAIDFPIHLKKMKRYDTQFLNKRYTMQIKGNATNIHIFTKSNSFLIRFQEECKKISDILTGVIFTR